jgi:hypothetical protein
MMGFKWPKAKYAEKKVASNQKSGLSRNVIRGLYIGKYPPLHPEEVISAVVIREKKYDKAKRKREKYQRKKKKRKWEVKG